MRRRMFFQGLAVGAGTWTLARAFRTQAESYGNLVPDPEGRFDLPAGFTYRILETAGDEMNDGRNVPGRPDGMACFVDPDDSSRLILMRNHENTAPNGGVSRLVVSASDATRISSNLVLTGTDRNCSGGIFPGRGWLTCEESKQDGYGYVFLCDLRADEVQEPVRIDGYGRYNHEAAAVDPVTFRAYLTEDESNGRLYRFVPDAPQEPFAGKLQALAVVDAAGFDTSDMNTGDEVEVEWVDIDAPLAGADNVRVEAGDKGAARVVRGEGICFYDGASYFCATTGGEGDGQVFALSDGATRGTLTCVIRSEDASKLRMPDNIVVAPSGDAFMAEDNPGNCFVRGLTPDGELFDLVRNNTGGSEFAGICFSPDGRFAFVNAQSLGLTLVIYREDGSAPFAAPMMMVPDAGVPDASVRDAGQEDASATDGGLADGSLMQPDAGTPKPGSDDDGCAIGSDGSGALAAAATALTVVATRRAPASAENDESR